MDITVIDRRAEILPLIMRWLVEEHPDNPITPYDIVQCLDKLVEVTLAIDEGDLEPWEALPESLQGPIVDLVDHWYKEEFDISTLEFIDALGTYAMRKRRIEHVKRRYNS